jgi:hypothetical protein
LTAYLYWYPEPGAGMVRTSLAYALEALPYRLVARGRGVLTEGGQIVPGRRGNYLALEAAITVDGRDLAAELRTAEAAVQSGTVFGLSASHAKTWGAYATAPVQRGQTVIPLRSPMSAIYSPSGIVAAGDYVVIESGYPWFDYEESRVASVSATSVTLATATKRSHPGAPLVRWREFFPHLAIAPGAEDRPWLTDRVPGVVWDLRIAAVEAIQSASRGLAVSQLQSGPGVGGRNTAPDGKDSPGGVLGAYLGGLAEPTATSLTRPEPTRSAPPGFRSGGGKGTI